MWDLVSYAKARVRRLCLEALWSGPKTPNGIAEDSGTHLSHISRALRELSAKGLVECVTPSAVKNRIYRITEDGRRVLKRLRGLS